MSDEIGKSRGDLVVPPIAKAIEPIHVPVQVIDGVVTAGIIGGTINMTLATNRIGALDGDF